MDVPTANKPTADAILVACPVCNAWPMAANVKLSWGSGRTVKFSCPRCCLTSTADEMSRRQTMNQREE
jgi:hypothetical protein